MKQTNWINSLLLSLRISIRKNIKRQILDFKIALNSVKINYKFYPLKVTIALFLLIAIRGLTSLNLFNLWNFPYHRFWFFIVKSFHIIKSHQTNYIIKYEMKDSLCRRSEKIISFVLFQSERGSWINILLNMQIKVSHFWYIMA